MTDPTWDIERVTALRARMSDADIEALHAREKSNPNSLTADEMGVLFIVTRERIRELEAMARDSSNEND